MISGLEDTKLVFIWYLSLFLSSDESKILDRDLESSSGKSNYTFDYLILFLLSLFLLGTKRDCLVIDSSTFITTFDCIRFPSFRLLFFFIEELFLDFFRDFDKLWERARSSSSTSQLPDIFYFFWLAFLNSWIYCAVIFIWELAWDPSDLRVCFLFWLIIPCAIKSPIFWPNKFWF